MNFSCDLWLLQKHHDGESAVVPHVFAPTFGNLFMKVAFNDRLPREKLHILQAYVHHNDFFIYLMICRIF